MSQSGAGGVAPIPAENLQAGWARRPGPVPADSHAGPQPLAIPPGGRLNAGSERAGGFPQDIISLASINLPVDHAVGLIEQIV